MFASPAYAQAAGGSAAPGGVSAILIQAAPLLFIFVIFYFLLIRPQQTRMKAHRALVDGVRRNDIVVTAGGLIGKVTKVDETEVEVEIAPNTRVRIIKSTLSEVRQAPGSKPAND
ncbi:MAG TPA: preprotein translocase subunit YajC [Sphingomonas sp.]|jgi:preprotein translocase subunit YajC|uniref:preprotein translocase subunit YajC n=1 Tax=Sphingomonas sp. TaxID=28214 RepID=UPI002ED8D9D1